MSSKDYELFIWSCFPKDFHAAREGLVHDSLLRLEGNEKQMAIDLLMGRLNRYLRWKWMKIEDRVIEAVGWFKLGEAVAPLQRLLRITKSPILKAQIGLSLYRISGYPQGVELAIEAFDRIPIYNQYNRLRCAEYLSIYAKEYKSAVKRLLKAVDDRDDFVAVYSIGLIKFAFEGKSQIISLVDTIIGTLGEHKEREPNEIITRKTALLRISDLIEIEFESDRKWL